MIAEQLEKEVGRMLCTCNCWLHGMISKLVHPDVMFFTIMTGPYIDCMDTTLFIRVYTHEGANIFK